MWEKDRLKNNEGIWEITPQALFEKIEENEKTFRVVDVRRPDEFNAELGHIKGAELVTLENEFKGAIESWNPKDTIVFVCRSGNRSGKATAYAQAKGFAEVFNMEGGMILWNALGLPTES
jgi:rhodanese-related sulfurtransferase